MIDEFILKQRVEQGQSIRATINQPGSNTVRREDISFCSARLLAVASLLQDKDPKFAEVVESVLQDLAAIQPEDALKTVKANLGTWPDSPVIYALGCHLIAQTLAEYGNDTSPQTVNELRESLEIWFGKFRRTLSACPQPVGDIELVCLAIYLTQSAIFHDKVAYDWVIDQGIRNMEPARFSSRYLIDLVCVTGSALDWSRDEGRFILFLERLEKAEEVFPQTDQIERLIGGPRLSELSRPDSPTSARNNKSEKPKKGFLSGLMEDLGDSIGWALPVIGFVAVGGFCLWGFGKYFTFFEETSYVGQQSLSEWYENADAMHNKNLEQAVEIAENGGMTEEIQRELEGTANSEDSDQLTINSDPVSEIIEPVEEPVEVTMAIDEEPASAMDASDQEVEPQPMVPETISETPVIADPDITMEPITGFEPRLDPFIAQDLPAEFVQTINTHREWMVPRFRLPRTYPNGTVTWMSHREMPLYDFDAQTGSRAIVRFPVNLHLGDETDPSQFVEAHYSMDQNGQWSVVQAARCYPNPDPATATALPLIYMQDPSELAWTMELFRPNPFYRILQ